MEFFHQVALYSGRPLQITHASFQNRQSWLSHKIPATDFWLQDHGGQICVTQGKPSLMQFEPQIHWV